DLLPHFVYDIEAEKATARKLKPNVDILEVSTKDVESLKKVANWIKFKMEMR
ncbi:MAG: hydrogenase accessory protein HypB, partial [Arcobacteraceae bacterium]